MFIVASGHLRCLDRLLKAAAVPASIYNEAAYAVLLHLSLQGKGLSLAGSNSIASAQQPSRALHSTTGLENDTPDSATAASDDGVCGAPQRVGEQAARAATAGPGAAAPQCADLARAVAATRKDLQDSKPAQPNRSTQPPPLQQQQQQQHNTASPPTWPSAMHEAGLQTAKPGTGRLRGIQQLLNKDLHRQELSDKVSKLQHKQQQHQGERQPQQPQQEGEPAAQAVPAAQVAAQISREEVQRRRALLREQLKAFEQRPKPEPPPLPQPAQQQVQQEKPNAAGVLAALRMPEKQQQKQQKQKQQQQQLQKQKQQLQKQQQQQQQRQQQQKQQQQQQQQQTQQQQKQQQQAAHAHPRHKGRLLPASSAFPLLLKEMLLLEPSHRAAAAAAVADDVAVGSTSACSSGFARGPVGTSQYSDWVEFDSRQVVNDGHDTFLGMWPDLPCLRPLELYGQQQDDSDNELELDELLLPSSEAYEPDGLPGSAAAATTDALATADTAQAADAAGLAAESSAGAGDKLLSPPAAADHAPLTFLERMEAAAAAMSTAAAAPHTPAFEKPDAAAAAAAATDDDDTEAAAAAAEAMPESADAGVSWAPEQEAPVDMEALQQRVLQEAAAMAGCPELPSPAAADGYTSGANQPAKWSVANMFDTADAAAAGEQLQEQLLEPDCWLFTAEAASEQLQHSWEPDPAGAVAAAAAAIRTSNIRAAAAAAALPQLPWPQHASLLCAMQHAMQQLEREEQQRQPTEHMQQAVWEARASDSSNGTHHNSAAVCSSITGAVAADSAAAAAATCAGGDPAVSLPFAWMYQSPPQQDAAAAASGGGQVYGLQYILQTLNDQQQPNGQLLLSEQEAPPAPSAQLLAPIEAPHLQYALEDSAQPKTQQNGQQQQPQQQPQQPLPQQPLSQQQPQQQPQQQRKEVPAWSQFLKDLWAAAKESYSFTSSTATSSDAAAGSTTSGEAAGGSVDTAGWQWDEQLQAQQQQQQHTHEAASIAGDGFVLLPQRCPRSMQQQAVVARVAAMSAGTCLEPLLWSVRENQHLQLLNQRAALAAAGWAATRRHALSRPCGVSVPALREQQQQQVKPQGVSCSQQQQMAAGDWFGSVLFAAHAALRQTGQLVLSPIQSAAGGPPPQEHSSNVGSSVTSSSSSSKDHAGSELAAATTFALVAEPPYNAAWDPVSSSWEGTWLQPQYGMAAADLQQHEQQQGPQQWQLPQLHLSAATGVQPDAACGVLLETIKACEDLAALQDTIQEYSHFLIQYPSLPAAVLQQAAGLLMAAAADSRQEGIYSLRALASGSGRAVGAARSAKAAAAASSSSSSSPASEADQTLHLGDVLAAEPFNKPAAVVYEALVRLYTEKPPHLFNLLLFASPRLSRGSSLDYLARGRGVAVPLQAAAEGQLQLLLLGISLRGTLLPSGTSLLLLLQQLQEGRMLRELDEGPLAGLCEQLLSRNAGLASWPAAEQQAASQLLLKSVLLLEPPSLLRLLQQLTQLEGSVLQAMEMPQKLYQAAMAQLVKAASLPQAPEELSQTGPQLLQLAREATLALGCLTMQAQEQGHVLPGGWYFEKSWQQRLPWDMHQSMVTFLNTQHKRHLTELQQWGKQPAASPEIAAEVMAAAASGQLQKVAGLLAALLQAGPAQEWLDAASAAGLLHLLVSSSPFCTYSSKDDALDVAAVFGSITGRPNKAAAALFQGGQAMAALPGVLFDQLLKKLQQDGPSLPPSAAVGAVWSAFELQYPQRPKIQPLLDSICSSRAFTKAGSSKTVTGGGALKGLVAARSLQKWPPGALHELLVLLHWHDSRSGANAGPRFELLPHTLEAIAAAAAQQACKLTAELARPAAAGLSSTASSTAVTKEVASICSIAMVMALRRHYNLPLLEALQDLLVVAAGAGAGAAAGPRRSGRKRGLASAQQPRVFTKFAFIRALYALATFDACSPAAAAAVRRMLPTMLPWCREADLARIAWSLALLNECDWQLWVDVKEAIKHNAGSAAADGRSNRWKSDEGAAEGDVVPGDMVAGGAADLAGFQAQAIQQQLHQAHIFVQHCVPDAAPLLPRRLAAAAQAAASQQADDVRVSQLQRDVGHMLGALQASSSSALLSYQLEHKTILGSTDIIVRLKGVSAPVAIEVDGPFHYPAGRRDQRLGSTVFRDRMLGANGFNVLALPYFVLDEAGEPGSAKAAAWLEQQLLRAAAAPTPKTGTSSSKPPGGSKPVGGSRRAGSSRPAGGKNVQQAAIELAEHLKQATAAAASSKA